MKKKLFFCLFILGLTANSQNSFSTAIKGSSTSPSGRAPQGSMRYVRNVWLITAAEMTAAGYTSGQVFSGLGFNYSVAQSIATDGSFTAYMQNTTDATNLKSNDWPTAIATMITVSNSGITIPVAIGAYDIAFAGGTAFTYTGGGLYIAFDYQNLTGTLSTANTALCNSVLTGGLRGVTSTINFAPNTTASSSFRPETRIGVKTLGITEFENSKVALYPNPGTNFITISGDNQTIKKIAIVTTDGKTIFAQNNIHSNTFKLNVANYQDGIYMVVIETIEGVTVIKKIIKQ